LLFDIPLFSAGSYSLTATLPVPMRKRRIYKGKVITKPDNVREGVHQKNNKIIWGNGCSLFSDCFTCPLKDCQMPMSEL
jgi:hypothetical protein